MSSAVSHDLLKRALAPNISEPSELVAARVAAVVAFAFGLAESSFFPAILLGIFSKRMNREGAVAGMVTGIGFTAAYIVYYKLSRACFRRPPRRSSV